MTDEAGQSRGGPLAGLKVLEFAGVGPTPMGTMMLADMGAEVVMIDRIEPVELGSPKTPGFDLLRRNRLVVKLDLKKNEALDCALALADRADVLIEGYRPGVMERLGLGPAVCHARNSRLVYARMTGWGQQGPLADRAGHDLNYIALTGARPRHRSVSSATSAVALYTWRWACWRLSSRVRARAWARSST